MPLTHTLQVFTAGREKQAGPLRAGSQLLCFYLWALAVQLEKDVYLHYLQKLILACWYSLPLHVNSASGHINDGPWGPTERRCARLSICSCRGRIAFRLEERWF